MLGMISARFEMSQAAADSGLRLAERLGRDHVRALCLVMLCYRWFLFDFDRCAELARQAYHAALTADDPFTRDLAQVMEAYTLITRDRNAEATELGRRGLAGSIPRSDRFCAALAEGVLLWAAAVTGHLAEARRAGERALELARPLGDFFAHGTVTADQVMVLGMMGELQAAHDLMDPLVKPFEDSSDAEIVGFRAAYGSLLLREGDLDGALAQFELGIAFAAPEVANWTAVRSMPGLAGVLRRLGRGEEALEVARHGEELARAFDGPRIVAQLLEEQGHLLLEGDPAAAEAVHHEALQIRLDHGLRTSYPDSLDALAACAAVADSYEEAARLLAASDAGREALAYPRPPVDLAPYQDLVKAIRAHLDSDDYDSVWAQGSALTLEDAAAYVRRARGTRGRPTSGWASLTPTEHDVVRLVSEGLTNPQVAERLFVSLSTVKTHLSHIFAKLGVSNRTELARQAVARRDEDPR
jgi:ATP/maltotriose-dependent transcriptional regulator MalT